MGRGGAGGVRGIGDRTLLHVLRGSKLNHAEVLYSIVLKGRTWNPLYHVWKTIPSTASCAMLGVEIKPPSPV